jgi:hypothetical protein
VSLAEIEARFGGSTTTVSRWFLRGFLLVERRRESGRYDARRVWIRAADVAVISPRDDRNEPLPQWLDGA